MPEVSIKNKPSVEDLISAIERLGHSDLDRITLRALQIRAGRKSSSLSDREGELFREIYLEKRAGFQERFDQLNALRRNSRLSNSERNELIELVNESEEFAARQLQALGELSQIRKTSVPALMKKLGLKAPEVALTYDLNGNQT